MRALPTSPLHLPCISPASPLQVQAALLGFMRELLSVAPQQALHAAAQGGGEGAAADARRVHSFAVADGLCQDTLRATADLPNAEAVAKRVLMCRADALG